MTDVHFLSVLFISLTGSYTNQISSSGYPPEGFMIFQPWKNYQKNKREKRNTKLQDQHFLLQGVPKKKFYQSTTIHLSPCNCYMRYQFHVSSQDSSHGIPPTWGSSRAGFLPPDSSHMGFLPCRIPPTGFLPLDSSQGNSSNTEFLQHMITPKQDF